MQMPWIRRNMSKVAGQASSPAFVRPLRAELFSDEQLRRHAMGLAGRHRLDPLRGPNRLLPRLADNEQVLLSAYDLVTAADAERQRGSPAGEWLLDNFHLIEAQIRLARLHLPRNYSSELPRLSGGASCTPGTLKSISRRCQKSSPGSTSI